MKILLVIGIVFISLQLALNEAIARSTRDCHTDGEELVESSQEEKPEWINRYRYDDGRYEYFTGLSTKNEKLEQAKSLALSEAKSSALQEIAELIQSQDRIVSTMSDTDLKKTIGSINAPTILNAKAEAWYHTKYAVYNNCRVEYYYNAYASIRVSKSDFENERQRAVIYLKRIQQKEAAKTPQLMPEETVKTTSRPMASEPVRAREPEPARNTWNNTNVTAIPAFNPYYFTIGSTKGQVLAVQGQPSVISGCCMWWYGSSWVTFDTKGNVDGYNNFSGVLKFRMQ